MHHRQRREWQEKGWATDETRTEQRERLPRAPSPGPGRRERFEGWKVSKSMALNPRRRTDVLAVGAAHECGSQSPGRPGPMPNSTARSGILRKPGILANAGPKGK